jgi:hypothetical protein
MDLARIGYEVSGQALSFSREDFIEGLAHIVEWPRPFAGRVVGASDRALAGWHLEQVDQTGPRSIPFLVVVGELGTEDVIRPGGKELSEAVSYSLFVADHGHAFGPARTLVRHHGEICR